MDFLEKLRLSENVRKLNERIIVWTKKTIHFSLMSHVSFVDVIRNNRFFQWLFNEDVLRRTRAILHIIFSFFCFFFLLMHVQFCDCNKTQHLEKIFFIWYRLCRSASGMLSAMLSDLLKLSAAAMVGINWTNLIWKCSNAKGKRETICDLGLLHHRRGRYL